MQLKQEMSFEVVQFESVPTAVQKMIKANFGLRNFFARFFKQRKSAQQIINLADSMYIFMTQVSAAGNRSGISIQKVEKIGPLYTVYWSSSMDYSKEIRLGNQSYCYEMIVIRNLTNVKVEVDFREV